jgi:hypothetical protein
MATTQCAKRLYPNLKGAALETEKQKIKVSVQLFLNSTRIVIKPTGEEYCKATRIWRTYARNNEGDDASGDDLRSRYMPSRDAH